MFRVRLKPRKTELNFRREEGYLLDTSREGEARFAMSLLTRGWPGMSCVVQRGAAPQSAVSAPGGRTAAIGVHWGPLGSI